MILVDDNIFVLNEYRTEKMQLRQYHSTEFEVIVTGSFVYKKLKSCSVGNGQIFWNFLYLEPGQISKIVFNAKMFDPFGANFTKWSNTPKKFVGNLPTNCLSVFDNFVGLALKGLNASSCYLSQKASS